MCSSYRSALPFFVCLFFLCCASHAPASPSGEFQQKVSEYTSGALSARQFLDICTGLLKEAPLSDKNFERQVRRYRSAVNIQLGDFSAAQSDAVFLLQSPATRLTGARALSLIYERRLNYPRALALLNQVIEEIEDGRDEAGLNLAFMREERTRLEKELQELVLVTAEELAVEIADSPKDAAQKYAGKILMVTGRVFKVPELRSESRVTLMLQASRPLICFLENGELPYLKRVKSGDTVTIAGRLKELNFEAVISPGHYLDADDAAP